MYRISGRGLFLFHNPHVSQIQIKTKEKVLFPRKTLILPLHQSRRGISLQSVVCTPIHIYPVAGLGLKGFSKEEKWTLKAMAEFLFHVSSLKTHLSSTKKSFVQMLFFCTRCMSVRRISVDKVKLHKGLDFLT